MQITKDFYTSQVLLGAHGRDYADFKNGTWEQWQFPIVEEYNKLSALGYENINIAASSTGCPLVLDMLQKHKIDLTNWTSIFKSIRLLGLNPIVENEDPNDESFDVGPITKVTKTSVYVRYFDSQGYLDKEPTKIPFNLITIVKFDGRYTNTMSKYLRERKTGTKR